MASCPDRPREPHFRKTIPMAVVEAATTMSFASKVGVAVAMPRPLEHATESEAVGSSLVGCDSGEALQHSPEAHTDCEVCASALVGHHSTCRVGRCCEADVCALKGEGHISTEARNSATESREIDFSLVGT